MITTNNDVKTGLIELVQLLKANQAMNSLHKRPLSISLEEDSDDKDLLFETAFGGLTFNTESWTNELSLGRPPKEQYLSIAKQFEKVTQTFTIIGKYINEMKLKRSKKDLVVVKTLKVIQEVVADTVSRAQILQSRLGTSPDQVDDDVHL